MTRRASWSLLACVVLASAVGAGDGVTPAKPGRELMRYDIVAVGESVVLLDRVTGDTWMLSRPKDGKPAQWLPIPKKGVTTPTQPPASGRRVPIIEEIDLEDLAPIPSKSVALSPTPQAFEDVRELAKLMGAKQAEWTLAKRIDPRRQSLVYFRWMSDSSKDRLVYTVEDDKVAFEFWPGARTGQWVHTRLFALRGGVRWRFEKKPRPEFEQPTPPANLPRVEEIEAQRLAPNPKLVDSDEPKAIVCRFVPDLARVFPDEDDVAAIARRVDFGSQQVLVFVWHRPDSNDSFGWRRDGDRIEFEYEFGPTTGRTVKNRVRVFALPKETEWNLDLDPRRKGERNSK